MSRTRNARLSLASAVAFIAAPATLAQTPAPPSAEDLATQQLLDEVFAVVGDEVITRNDVLGMMSSRFRDEWEGLRNIADPAQQGQALVNLQLRAAEEIAKLMMQKRAGEERGFDEETVQRLVNDYFEDQRLGLGGSVEFQRYLGQRNETPDSYKKRLRQDVLRSAWRGSMVGAQPGPTGRTERDRYVRPGLLRSSYRRLNASPNFREVIGAYPERVRVRRLALDPRSIYRGQGNEQEALAWTRAYAEEIVKEVSAGRQEFGALVTSVDVRRGAESSLTWEVATIGEEAAGLDPAEDLVRFVQTAEAGDVSPVIEMSGGLVLVFQLEERLLAEEPGSFGDLETQQSVRSWVLGEQDRIRLGRAMRTLLDRTHIEPPELSQQIRAGLFRRRP